MESDTHPLYFTKLSGKLLDFYFLVGIHLNCLSCTLWQIKKKKNSCIFYWIKSRHSLASFLIFISANLIEIHEFNWRERRRTQIMWSVNLHRLISAAIGRWVTSDPAELPFLPGRKKLWTSAVEYNPYVTKGKTQVSPRFIIKIQHIYVFHMYDC